MTKSESRTPGKKEGLLQKQQSSVDRVQVLFFFTCWPKVTFIQTCTATASSAENQKRQRNRDWPRKTSNEIFKNEVIKMLSWEWWQNNRQIVDLHPGKAACPAPDVLTLGFWWHDRRLAALCAAAGHPDPSRTRAEWEWALAIALGSPDGPPWLSVLQSGSLSVGKTQRKKFPRGKTFKQQKERQEFYCI